MELQKSDMTEWLSKLTNACSTLASACVCKDKHWPRSPSMLKADVKPIIFLTYLRNEMRKCWGKLWKYQSTGCKNWDMISKRQIKLYLEKTSSFNKIRPFSQLLPYVHLNKKSKPLEYSGSYCFVFVGCKLHLC